jgi:Methyltransferase domain
MNQHGFSGFGPKLELLERLVRNASVLHLGAVGETCQPLAAKVAAAPRSTHARLTHAASQCVGIDIDRAGVDALTELGIFDNLVWGDALKLSRDDIPLPSIDFIVAADILEHLSSPGELLDAARVISDPDTRLVLTTPNSLGLPAFLRYLRGQALEGIDQKVSFNVYSLGNLLSHHGWHIECLKTCYQAAASRLHSRLVMSVGRAAFARWPSIGGTLFVVARAHP